MVHISAFGVCNAGPVSRITLSDGAGMAVELLSLGAAVRAITVPDRSGKPVDVCLGYDTAQAYRDYDGCLGGIIGRSANRTGGARFKLDGKLWRVTPNLGPHHLHGGTEGFHRRLWAFAAGENSVTFSLDSPHLDEGYPGNLHVEVTYTLIQPGRLEVSYRAVTDQDTVVNLTNHSYFNLSGHASGPVVDHVLTVRASHYTLCDEDSIPTGALASVLDTPLDFRDPAPIGPRLFHPMLLPTRGFDQNYVLDGPRTAPAAELWSPATGIALEVTTSLEGMQLYASGNLSARTGKRNAVYGPGHALCLETQHLPDAVNHPEFPTSVLKAGELYAHKTDYRFYCREM